MHQKVGYALKYPTVAGVFKGTMNQIVNLGCDFGYSRNTLAMRQKLKTAAIEYKEFNNIDLDDDKVFKYYASLSPINTN